MSHGQNYFKQDSKIDNKEQKCENESASIKAQNISNTCKSNRQDQNAHELILNQDLDNNQNFTDIQKEAHSSKLYSNRIQKPQQRAKQFKTSIKDKKQVIKIDKESNSDDMELDFDLRFSYPFYEFLFSLIFYQQPLFFSKNKLNFTKFSKHKETKGILLILRKMIKNIKILPYLIQYLQKIIYYLHNNKVLSSFKQSFTGFDIPMLTSQDRHRSKSIKRIRMKSPFDMGLKGTIEEQTHGKNLLKKSKQSNSESTDSERKIITKSGQNRDSFDKLMKKLTSTEQFKNKIMISSSEFNKLKQKLETHTGSSQSSTGPSFKQPKQKKLKIKILNGLSKQTSDTSDKNNTIRDSEGSSDSEQIQLLKVENEYFKKIYDEAMDELSKLKNKLKQEKKVHEVQKQIYQNQINKLKRIVDSDREQVSHIICDQDNRYIIVVESIGNASTEDCTLGIDSDCEESIGDLMLESKLCP